LRVIDASIMSTIETCSLYRLTIVPANFDAFKPLADEPVAATRKEPDTITCEFLVNADHAKAHIIERCRTSGLLPHVKQTFAPYVEPSASSRG